MLPLWIIDLTQDSNRRDAFMKRLGDVYGTLIGEDKINEFLQSYETTDALKKDCVWYYSHFENPFLKEPFSTDDVNFAYNPNQHFDWESYIETPSKAELETVQKIKELEERDRKYRLDMLRTLYRDYQEFVVAKGQSLMEVLSESMSKAKDDAFAKSGVVSSNETDSAPHNFQKEFAELLYKNIQKKLDNEEIELKDFLVKVQKEARDKVDADAKIIAETHAKAMRDRQLAFHKEKFEHLYKGFKKKIEAEAVSFRENLSDSASTINGVTSQTFNGAVNEIDSAYNKGVFETLYQNFQETVVRESKTFMDLLVKEISDAQTNLVAIEEREADYHRKIAKVLYTEFQQKVVAEGQRFIEVIRRTRAHACTTFNVCVIGDSREAFSRLVFPSVAVMLQKEKGRILPDHIHQGLSILGTFFVPANINALSVEMRNKVRRTVEEIDVQHRISTVRGYDRMLFYQNVQNRTENFYPLLNEQDSVDYLVQCLVNIYYACSEVHPLLTGSVSDEKFYFSMGPVALFYDTAIQDKLDRQCVVKGLFEEFLKDGDMNEPDPSFRLFSAGDYLDEVLDKKRDKGEKNKGDESPYVKLSPYLKPTAMVKCFEDFTIDIDNLNDPQPRKHPVSDFFHKRLERDYYLDDLRKFPTELKFQINKEIENCSTDIMEKCSKIRQNMTRDFTTKIFPNAIRDLLLTCDKNTGGLCRLEKNVDALKKNLGEFQRKIDESLESKIWQDIIIDPIDGTPAKVPPKMLDAFEDYHGAYVSDLKNPGKSTNCEDQRKAAMDALIADLQMETPLISRIARVFLQSLITVIWGVPLLNMLSPNIIDLGHIYSHVVMWTIILFMAPVLFQGARIFFQGLVRQRKIRKVKAIYLHDAYARLVNRAYSEIYKFYESCKELCDLYLERFKNIREDVRMDAEPEDKRELPNTKFCQDLVGGSFRDEIIMDRSEIADGIIRIQHSMKRVITELDREDYFSLIRGHSGSLNLLMQDITLSEDQKHHYDEIAQMEVYESKDYQQKENAKNWKEKIIKEFKETLRANVQKDILPRECSTVGEKIMEYYDKYVDDPSKQVATMLSPFVNFSATNGEFTSSADLEVADIKCSNPRIEDLLVGMLRENVVFQPAKDALYGRYLFLTRWRTFDYVRLNRVLPSEDFDLGTREKRVSKDKDMASSREICLPSSLFLLSLCQTTESRDTEWLRLFPERIPSKLVWSDMKAYQDILNDDD